MRKITLVLALFVGLSGTISSQEKKNEKLNLDFPTAYYNSQTVAVKDNQKTGAANPNFDFGVPIPETGGVFTPKPGATHALIYDNGPYFNIAGSPDLSRLEDTSLGFNSYGYSSNHTTHFVADDFILTDQMEITSFDFYGYQTGGPTNSINQVFVQIWDGDPSSGNATVVWGDRTTNISGGVESSNAYRELESAPGDRSREIQRVTASTSNLILNAGTYWVEYSFAGIGVSGPWAPPIAILGMPSTGDALQYDVTLNSWAPLIDDGLNASQGLPFQIYGSPTVFPGVYCGPIEFPTNVEPITRVNIGDIDNVSDETLNGSPQHEDFTSEISLVEEGQIYPIVLEGNTNGNNINRFVVFIDWNQNGVLNDPGEVYEMTQLLTNSTGGDGKQVVDSIAVPMGAKIGKTRMRVKKISGTTDLLDPCLGAGLGQAEDYSLTVVAAGHFPPSNDECIDAIAISCGDSIMGSTKNATTDFGAPVCGNISATSPGVWYVLNDNSSVPGDITVSLCSSNTVFNTKLSVYSGNCSNLVCIAGDNDGCGEQSKVTFASDGNTEYYILVHGFDGQTGVFELEVSCSPLIGTPDNTIDGFSFYPNPSQDLVNLHSKSNIESVVLYNVLGQSVMEKTIDSPAFEMDVSNIARGNYLMKVTVDGETAIYRMVKM